MKKQNGRNAKQLRSSAETQIANTSQTEYSPQSDHKTLHELHVHQIELEMQNEELQRAHALLEKSRDSYLQLYDFAPVCYLTLTEYGLIKEVNLTCTKLLGIDRKKMLNSQFAHYIAPEDGDRWHQFKMYIKQHSGIEDLELTLRRADGTRFLANLMCQPVDIEAGISVLNVTLIDISVKKQTEELLRIAATAFEMQEGIMVTNADKVILQVNQAFTRITGYSAIEAIGQHPSMLSSGLHDKHFYQSMWASVMRDGFWQGEIWDKRKNGEVFPIWLTHTAIAGDNGSPTNFVGSFIDITNQKHAEKLLLETHQQLENQIGNTTDELGKTKHEAAEYNTALNVLLKQQNKNMLDAQHELVSKLSGTVFPFMERLKRSGLDHNQAQLLKIIEVNLHDVTASHGRPNHMSAVYQQLTPVEIQVASLVRQGFSTKAIASTLTLSAETIGVHRKHIRKKLGLGHNAANLRSFLLSMDD